jgi:hypothetical protein
VSNIWAIASKMIVEALRRRVPLALACFALAMIVTLPFVLRSDGTFKGQIQLALSYSLTLTFFILMLLTIFLSTMSFTGEIKYKQIYLLDTKPLARWQFFIGKLAGVALLNLTFLAVLGLASGGMVAYLLATHKDPAESLRVREELLSCYRGCRPYINMKLLDSVVAEEFQRRLQEGRLPTDQSEAVIKQEIRQEQLYMSHWIPYRLEQIWTFRDLPSSLPKDKKHKLKVRYKLFTSNATPGAWCKVAWQIGRGENKYVWEGRVKSGEFLEFTVPTTVIDERKNVDIRFAHQDASVGFIYFPMGSGLELFYPAGGFWSNYLRALLLLFSLLCFVCLVALFASTFLTFPVAVLLSLYIITLGLVADFMLEILPINPNLMTHEAQKWWNLIYRETMRFLFTLIPNFSQYNPVAYLSEGRVIAWSLVADSLVKLVLLRGGLLAALGCWIFYQREIGKPLE